MRGFVVGSLILIGLYVAGGDQASGYLGGGLDVVAGIVRRLGDPSVAAVPQKGYHTALNPVPSGGGGGVPHATSAVPGNPVLST